MNAAEFITTGDANCLVLILRPHLFCNLGHYSPWFNSSKEKRNRSLAQKPRGMLSSHRRVVGLLYQQTGLGAAGQQPAPRAYTTEINDLQLKARAPGQ